MDNLRPRLLRAPEWPPADEMLFQGRSTVAVWHVCRGVGLEMASVV